MYQGGELRRRRQDLTSSAAVWIDCDKLIMEKMQAELQALTAGLKKQSDDSTVVLQAINESLKAFNSATTCKD